MGTRRSFAALVTGRSVPRMARGGALARSPMPAAIRIPGRAAPHLRLVSPSAPHLFVHEGVRQSIERRLRAAFVGPVILSITDNRHSMISHTREGGVHQVRLHHMFLDAPARTIDALARYLANGDRDASIELGHFIEANSARLSRQRRHVRPVTRGKHHDLLAIFKDINEKYFGGEVSAVITWGRHGRRKGTSRNSIKLGSYAALDKLIRIHPVLDRAWVPRYFVSFIVFHEMLHHVMPGSRGVGRRLLHPPEFRLREAEFRKYARAMEWERKNIGRLLRA